MNVFFLFLELLSYGFAGFLFVKKKELAILYLPVLTFINTVIEPALPKAVFAAVITAFIVFFIVKNQFFYKKNIFSILLIFYFLVLLTQSYGAAEIKGPHILSVIWLFTLIPIIETMYQKYPRDVIFKELTNAAFIMLIVFIVNVFLSTKFKFSPNEMYHITSGILYGNLYAAGFNSLAITLFILLLRVVSERKIMHFLVFIISFGFVMLCLRRSVMGLSALGVFIAAIGMASQAKVKQLLSFGLMVVIIGYVVYLNTDFADQFTERVELRQLDERSLEEEKRLFEYELLYRDMFIDKKYSPWFGFELFNSPGNYGGGVFYERSLHGDLPSLAHSSGILGVFLYLMMMATAFLSALRSAGSKQDKLIVAFCALAFLVYTGTGRLTEFTSLFLIMLLVMLPKAQTKHKEVGFGIEDAEYEVIEEESTVVHGRIPVKNRVPT